MLTVDTKRHIDAARQVLVGKVPDPKQQIDQITNALIYKFMDDMDIQARDAGGKPSFFIGDLEQYAWRKLMDPRKGAQEKLNLYTEALEKFSTAQQLPQLFRDIFRQAFLPYRDPATLNLFLKEIQYFDYGHSEELGNAFEYLLSIMGSQGDAGQFRTPRHIIDFIVDIIDPDYTDTILDPACGTAGFLISTYKHIVAKHDGVDETGKSNNETPLTHQQRQQLFSNLQGYDISSDMVKLARVNMYLHGNNQPNIFEYDSLTSEERWGDNFDVILANPPFMSPKGGIRPHNKFGVESSRAEVLFVDYIKSHLKQNGRAGIIVPEGIIFQSGKSYKQLRKALVDDGLIAVISLPPGVFNPYSGVKTSILIFDNNHAKQAKDIVFAKVEHDGFDLGAQRRPTPGKNELPIIAKLLREYKENPDSNIQELKSKIAQSNFFTIGVSTIGGPDIIGSSAEVEKIEITSVSRDKLAESGEYNLSASRYVTEVTNQNQKWPLLAIEELVETVTAKVKIKSSEVIDSGKIPVIDQSQKFIAGYTDNNNALLSPGQIVAFGDHTRSVKYVDFDFAQGADGIKILKPNARIVAKYLYFIMSNMELPNKGYSRHWTEVKRIKIPLPSIELQEQIVRELDSYQKIIDGARQVVNSYRPILRVDSLWPEVELGEILDYEQPTKYIVESVDYNNSYTTPVLTAGKTFILGYTNEKTGIFQQKYLPVIIFDDFTTATKLVDFPFKVKSSAMKILHARKQADIRYVFYAMQKIKFNPIEHKRFWISQYSKIKIPLPPLSKQQELALEIQTEQAAVNSNKELIKIYEQKIKDKIFEVWGE